MQKPEKINILSWIEVPDGNNFPLWNLPYGIAVDKREKPFVATRIGETVIDLSVISKEGLLEKSGISQAAFSTDVLNVMIAYGRKSWTGLREILLSIFEENNPVVRDNTDLRRRALLPEENVRMLMPLQVGDYTDFYSSIEHATNLGKIFRDETNPLLPNWKHMPVGYHGRTSSIIVSGTEIFRPNGQIRPDDTKPPVFSPTRQLDFELEIAFVTGKKTDLGESISTAEAEDAIFGFLMFNDLSARDIQKWEYVPLGPFLGKNFGSVISPWVVTLDALEPFRVEGPEQKTPVLPYLSFTGKHNFDICLEVFLKPENGREYPISQTNYKYMYWNIVQQLAHQTVNGCNINVGDLYASGTISGPDPGSEGSLIEMTFGGKKPIQLEDGLTRTFLEDGDTIIFRGYAEKNGFRVGFGEVSTKIIPAKNKIKAVKIDGNERINQQKISAG